MLPACFFTQGSRKGTSCASLRSQYMTYPERFVTRTQRKLHTLVWSLYYIYTNVAETVHRTVSTPRQYVGLPGKSGNANIKLRPQGRSFSCLRIFSAKYMNVVSDTVRITILNAYDTCSLVRSFILYLCFEYDIINIIYVYEKGIRK